MAKLWLDVMNKDVLVYDTEKVAVFNGKALLMAFDQSGNPELVDSENGFFGRYEQEGILQLRPVSLGDCVEFFSIEGDFEALNGTSISFQISLDGTNWLYWDGVNWIVAGTNWNVLGDLNWGLSVSPIVPRTLYVRVRLEANYARDKTPVFRSIALGVELKTNFTEDVIRSVTRAIRAWAKPRQVVTILHTSALAQQKVDHDFRRFQFCDYVYNVTDDPKRKTNIFSSIDGTDKQLVKFTVAPALGKTLEMMIVGDVDVTAGPVDADYLSSHAPVFVVTATMGRRYLPSGRPMGQEVVTNVYKRRARIGREPRVDEIDVVVFCVSKYNVTTMAMADSLEEIFGDDVALELRSVGNGEILDVVDFIPLDVRDKVEEGMDQKTVKFTVSGKRWHGGFKEVPVAEEFELVGNARLGFIEQVEEVTHEGG